jgi:MoxR-like ATPase
VEATSEADDIVVGASPRALLAFVAAAKALAFVRGREHCIPDDFKELAVPVLAHRLTVDTQYTLSKNTKFISKRDLAESVVDRILDEVVCPTEDFD